MPSSLTLPAFRQTVTELCCPAPELCTAEHLPSLLEALREVPDLRAPHLVTPGRCCWAGRLRHAVRSALGARRSALGGGQGGGILAALEVPGGAPARLPVPTTLTRALARAHGDALDAATGCFVQAHTHDSLAASPGTSRSRSRPRTARRSEAPATRRACSCTCSASTRSTLA
ncbi:hypothetical protein ACTWQF_03040 [Streptomyces sp. 8N114]|uniref:hypothetical protein n=1 Tax=Streptomyces sp. 8N114 TaxID=3457419 RepID=UPI003FD28EBD